MFMLKRYHGEDEYIIMWDLIVLDKDLQYEEKPIAIFDRDVLKLKNKEDIKFVKVQWNIDQLRKLLGRPRWTCKTSIPIVRRIRYSLVPF